MTATIGHGACLDERYLIRAHGKVPQLVRINALVTEAVLAWPEWACVNDVRRLSSSRQEVPEPVMSHCLRPLRLALMCCAAAAIAGPALAQPQNPATPPPAATPAPPP